MRRWGNRLIRVVAAALITLAAAPLANASPAAGRLGIQLVDAPISARADPRAHLYIVDQLAPGAMITRHVRVTNFSSDKSAVAIYPAGASIRDGQFRFADDRTGDELTSWIGMGASTATLQPEGHIDIAFRIAVPRDAVGGERYAVIWAERASPPIVNGAREINRVGVRIYLDVSGAKRRTDFAITSLSAERDPGGVPRLVAQVRNIGDRAVDVSGTVALTAGPGGTSAGPIPTAKPVTIAPGETQPVTTDFDPQLVAGPWQAAVSLASGLVHHAASATVTFPTSGARTVSTPASSPGPAHWWWWLLIAAAVAATTIGRAIALRRRHRSTQARS